MTHERTLYGTPTQVHAFFHERFWTGCADWTEEMQFVMLWEQAKQHIRECHNHAWPRFANYERLAQAIIKRG